MVHQPQQRTNSTRCVVHFDVCFQAQRQMLCRPWQTSKSTLCVVHNDVVCFQAQCQMVFQPRQRLKSTLCVTDNNVVASRRSAGWYEQLKATRTHCGCIGSGLTLPSKGMITCKRLRRLLMTQQLNSIMYSVSCLSCDSAMHTVMGVKPTNWFHC